MLVLVSPIRVWRSDGGATGYASRVVWWGVVPRMVLVVVGVGWVAPVPGVLVGGDTPSVI